MVESTAKRSAGLDIHKKVIVCTVALLSTSMLSMLVCICRVINAEIADTLQNFNSQVKDGKNLIAKSAGALIFPCTSASQYNSNKKNITKQIINTSIQ